MKTRRETRVLLLSALAAAVAVASVTSAQDQQAPVFPPGMMGELDGLIAFDEARNGHHIKARELAEDVVRARPDDFVGHFVLGYVHHWGEANFARALYHLNRARSLIEVDGERPPPDVERWHRMILRQLAMTNGHLERYETQLAYMDRYNRIYGPDFIAERAWPNMKLRRFDAAREAATQGLEHGDAMQRSIALNALCAVEFEAGDDQASYVACEAAMNADGADPSIQSAVDFTNFAEAARAVFRLDEAERVDLLATEARVAWYGNPWVELGELYVREGRYVEALNAMRRAPEYREQRPPHVRNADRNDARRALTSFFLAIGRAEDAVDISQKALTFQDRRAHNSRDPHQDRAISALLHRAALRLRAERELEAAAGMGFFDAMGSRFSAASDRWSGWLSGRITSRNLADEERLVGTFMIGTHRSAVMPPWLVGELVDVLGAGVVEEAVRRAREEDDREGSDAFYDAFLADAALAGGDDVRARELSTRSLEALGPAEAMLRARLYAIRAAASRSLGDQAAAEEAYGAAFQSDPGIFRRMGLTVPVRYRLRGAVAEDIGDVLSATPRFDTEDWGMAVDIEADSRHARSCFLDPADSQLSCVNTTPENEEDLDAFIRRAAEELLEAAFAPRVDLSQADANGLDGSNRVSRDPLRTMFGVEPPPRE